MSLPAPLPLRALRRLRCTTTVGCLALLITATALHAGLFEEGQAAFDREDYRLALARWNNAARQFDARALHGLAELHRHGLGTPKNEKPVVGLYRRSANLGFAPAQASLAECLGNGLFGAAADKTASIEFAKRAAAQGNRAALDLLEDAYGRGEGVERNYQESAYWGLLNVRLLNEQIAALERNPSRTPREEERLTMLRTETSTLGATLALRQRGAEARWPSAAQLKEIQQRVAAFRPQEVSLLEGAKQAVAQGERDGAGFLGSAYANGEGVVKDPLESLYWFHVHARLLAIDVAAKPSLQTLVAQEAGRLTQLEFAGKNAGWLDDAKLAALKTRADGFVATLKTNAK